MAYHLIEFENTEDPAVTRLGGLPLIADAKDWPRFPKTGRPLMLLCSIAGDFLVPAFPGLKVPDGHRLSVFCAWDQDDFDTTESLMIHGQADLGVLAQGGSQVLVHPAANTPCPAPDGAPPVIPMRKMRLKPVPAGDENGKDPHRGDGACKVGGKAGWIQDPVTVDGLRFVMQLDESPLGPGYHPHSGLFEGGLGFLLLKDSLAPGVAGTFFLQFA